MATAVTLSGSRATAASWQHTMARVVTLCDGHAFYLDELIRAVAAGKGAALPETVLAMAARASYLTGVPENARAVELAAQWLPDTLDCMAS